MVFGKSMAVILVPLLNQCADITRTALGTGISFAIAFQRWLNSLSSIPFIGEPWPINKTGMIDSCSFRSPVNLLNADKLFIVLLPCLFCLPYPYRRGIDALDSSPLTTTIERLCFRSRHRFSSLMIRTANLRLHRY